MQILEGQGQGQGPAVDMRECKNIRCGNCDNIFFQPVVIFKKISAIVSPTGKEEKQPLQLMACTECGHILDEYKPFLQEPMTEEEPEESKLIISRPTGDE